MTEPLNPLRQFARCENSVLLAAEKSRVPAGRNSHCFALT
jgi:hypothetical protein